MQNKNTLVLIAVLCLIVGVGAGWYMGSHQSDHAPMVMDNGMTMTQTMDGMTASLTGKTGDAFDKAFVDEMIVHHQGAVDMAHAALTSAKHQEIKDMANAIITAQTKEIAQMEAWRTAWFGK